MLKNLFGKKNQKDGKYVARWVEGVLSEPRPSHSLEDQFFISLVLNLITFGVERKGDEQSGDFESAVNENNMDSALFELACMRFVEFDYYLFRHHKEIRSKSSGWLQWKMTNLFKSALGKKYIDDIFHERVEAYGKLLREGKKNDEGDTAHLASILTLATGNQLVRVYDFEKTPMENAGFSAFEHLDSLGRVTAWYVAFTPLFYSLLEDVCPQLGR